MRIVCPNSMKLNRIPIKTELGVGGGAFSAGRVGRSPSPSQRASEHSCPPGTSLPTFLPAFTGARRERVAPVSFAPASRSPKMVKSSGQPMLVVRPLAVIEDRVLRSQVTAIRLEPRVDELGLNRHDAAIVSRG